MRIHYEESGGFAGLSRCCDLDANQLSADDRALFESLIEPIRESIDTHSAQARDVLQYELTIETGDRNVRISVDDVTAPAALRPLLKFLRKHAKSMGSR